MTWKFYIIIKGGPASLADSLQRTQTPANAAASHSPNKEQTFKSISTLASVYKFQYCVQGGLLKYKNAHETCACVCGLHMNTLQNFSIMKTREN